MPNYHNGISEKLITAQLFERMQQCGIIPRETFNPDIDGQTHRFATEQDRGSEKSGAYYVHNDGGAITLGVMDFRLHDGMQNFTLDFKSAFTPDERREYLKQNNISNSRNFSGIRTITQSQRKEAERRKMKKSKRQKEIQQMARTMALAEYSNAWPDFNNHPYIRSRFSDKGISIPDYGVFDTSYSEDYDKITRYTAKLVRDVLPNGKCKQGDLLIPFVDVATGDFATLQRIPNTPNERTKFDKWFYGGLPVTGAAHILMPDGGENSPLVFCCEGFVTGLAVLIITGGRLPVFCVGGCNNYIHVCTALRTRYPKMKICIMADNDTHGKGKEAAIKCISAGVADFYKLPANAGTDFYDLVSRKAGY